MGTLILLITGQMEILGSCSLVVLLVLGVKVSFGLSILFFVYI